MVAQTCVCTVPLARDEREARLIRGTLEHLSGAGVPVVVADGGSPPEFVSRSERYHTCPSSIPQQADLVGQVQAAFADRRADAISRFVRGRACRRVIEILSAVPCPARAAPRRSARSHRTRGFRR